MPKNLNGNKPPQVFRQKIWAGKKGISIVEILVVVAILGVTLTSLLGLINFSLKSSRITKQTIQANFLAQEIIEATRTIRDQGWANLTNGSHGINNVTGIWEFDGTENIINGFSRSILIESGRRDANDDIVESGGVSDPDTKKATVTVSWQEEGRTHEVKIITYLTNWQQ